MFDVYVLANISERQICSRYKVKKAVGVDKNYFLVTVAL